MFERFRGYRWSSFGGDVLAGTLAAVILIPQAMAYAMLAGLPPAVGLYACILPLAIYGLVGSSPSLSVGPVALLALLVFSSVGQLATPGSPEYIALCGTLALLSGLIKVTMGLFRMGFLTSFISHPVMVGFTNAAAVVIIVSQFKYLLGISVPQAALPIDWIAATLAEIPESNLPTLAMGLASSAVLWWAATGWYGVLKKQGRGRAIGKWLARLAPLIVVIVTTLLVAGTRWDESAALGIVGSVPAGLPSWRWPRIDLATIRSLLPVAAAVALIGYIQSMSVAQSLASRRRQRINADRELLALGLADMGAAVTQGFPVTGSFSGSAVRDAAGSQTPLASLVSSLMVAAAVVWATAWLYFIPQAVLGAIVVVSVVTVIDLRTPFRLWRYSRNDAFALWITFAAVIIWGIESGIATGVVTTFATWLWRTSRPQIIEVGRIPHSEHFRNIRRHHVEVDPRVLALRLDESLYFANARYLHQFVMRQLAERRDVRAVLLIASGVNRIDATGIEVLKTLVDDLQRAGVQLVMSDVKWAVTERLQRSGFDAEFLKERVYLSADAAFRKLHDEAPQADGDREAQTS